MDAEMAFLAAQNQEYDPATDYTLAAQQPAGDEDEDEYDPISAFAAPQSRSPSAQSASMPVSAANTPPPATDSALKPQAADASAAPTPSRQRTRGGFVDESEDDEDEVPVAKPKTAGSALLNASGVATESPQRSLSNTPNNTLPPQAVPLHSAQDQGAVHDTASIASPAVPNGAMPVPDATKPGAADHLKAASARQSATPVTPAVSSLPKPRLPQDRVGILEDRITEDPRGDIEAWLALIDEHRRRHKYDEARAVYERFFEVFPTAGEQWVEYVNMESELDEKKRMEQIFSRSIMKSPYVPLWSSYINYIRRINNLTNDPEGKARGVVTQVYEFVLDKIGIDPHSGKIWADYIEFIKSGPGTLGGHDWQGGQKMDAMRKVYQRAIAVPTNATLELWKEYGNFETMLNKATGRKNLQEKSASYMTARSAIHILNNITKGVNRTTLPKLPPAAGFDGAEAYSNQVQAWKQWIEWEKSDPLEIKEDDKVLYNKRILYLYKNALMALRFWPEMWYEATEWCYQNGLQQDGDELLKDGMEANPESCLLAFKKAHQTELRTDFEDGEAGLIKKGEAIRGPYKKVLDALYDLTNKAKKREEQSLARAKEAFAAQHAAEEAARANSARSDDDDDEDDSGVAARRQKEKQDALDAQLRGISSAANAEIHTLKKTLSYAWIALMRAMRRVQGKGATTGPIPGFRGIFTQARKRGKLLSDAYVASALIEHHCYHDTAATKIFDRGMKLFPDDENFALQYIKHLVKLNDATNARAVFETVVSRLTQKPESAHRAKPLFVFFHDYESQFGELAQIVKLEQRMATLFPEDPQLTRFASRFSSETFDPTVIRPIISPRTQMRPAMPANIIPTVEEPPSVPPQLQIQEQRLASPALMNSPRLGNLMPATNSPKRPLDDADNELNQPRKLVRGESPLKGAAGRRLDAARRNQGVGGGSTPMNTAPTPLPREINFLFSIIPPAHAYRETRFNPERMVDLIRRTPIQMPQGGVPPPVSSGPPSAQIGAQLQNIQARYGGGGGWS